MNGHSTARNDRASIRRHAARVAGGYAVAAAAWILLSDFLMAAVFPTPESLVWASVAKGLAFVLVTAAVLFGLILGWAPAPPPENVGTGHAHRLPAALFLVASAAILATGLLAFERQRETIRADKTAELAAIADLKVGQISTWIKERRGDAEVLRADSLLAAAVAGWRASAGRDEAEAIRKRLDALAREYDYWSVILTDPDGQELMRAGGAEALNHPEGVEMMEQAFREDRIVVSDLHRPLPHLPIELDILVPLKLEGRPVAALYVAVDPDRFLFPLIQAWPTPSPSAETLLVRRDGDDALFLNRLRHRDDPPLTLRVPLSRTDIPASPAARGREKLMEGVDYRGVPVLAATRNIPGSPWAMVAKVDRDEVFAPIRRLAATSGLVTAIVWLAMAAVGLAWWRRERERHAAALKLAEEKQQALTRHFDYLSRHANDIILLADEEGRIVEANDRAIESYGYGREDLIGMDVRHLKAPPAIPGFAADWEMEKNPAGAIFRAVHRRNDGTEFPVEVSSRPLVVMNGTYHQKIVRDITERVASEREIVRLNTMYRMLSRTNEAILRARNDGELFSSVCGIATDIGGFLLAWIGIIGDQDDKLHILARAGTARDYVDGVVFTTRGHQPSGRGPTGAAIREGRTQVCLDFEANPDTEFWHFRALKYGIRAGAAIPIRQDGRTIGALTVYTGDPQLFREEIVALLEEMAADISFALDVLHIAEDRRRLLAELEERVCQRTADLEAANAEMEAFTYSVSHDLRGPLRALDGYSQAIAEDYAGKLDDKGRLYLRYLREGAQEMGLMIDAFLRLSRSTRGELVWSRVDLSALAREVLDKLRERDPERRVAVETTPGIVVHGDERLLRVVLDNLLANAWKYTRKTEDARIAFAAETREGKVACHVRDNGVGFDMAYADKLFKPFCRLHRKDEFEGSGIGLSTVERIVRRHGGRVWAEGVVGEGAAFHFELPA